MRPGLSTVATPTKNRYARDDDRYGYNLQRIHGLVKNYRREDSDPNVPQSDDRVEDGNLAMAQGIDEQNRENAVETVPGEQRRNGENPEHGFEETGVGQAIGPDLDQYLRRCNQQRATSHDERRLPTFAWIDHASVRRKSDSTQ